MGHLKKITLYDENHSFALVVCDIVFLTMNQKLYILCFSFILSFNAQAGVCSSVFSKLFGRKSKLTSQGAKPKPTLQESKLILLEELNQPDLEIDVQLTARPLGGYRHYGRGSFPGSSIHPTGDLIHSSFGSAHLGEPGDYIYLSSYYTDRAKDGWFVIAFTLKQQTQQLGAEIDNRISLHAHLIAWRSKAKIAELSEQIVRKIFEELYKGDPISKSREAYEQIAVRPPNKAYDEILHPLVFKDRGIDQVKQIIIKVLSEHEP